MAITVFTNALVLINSIDLSDHVSKVTTTDTRATVDITAMGATAITITKGLGDAKIAIDFFQDDATGKVHQTLFPLISSSTSFPVEIRRTNAARSATNLTVLLAGALLMNYSGLDGKVGDALGISVEFQNAVQAGMTYPTS